MFNDRWFTPVIIVALFWSIFLKVASTAGRAAGGKCEEQQRHNNNGDILPINWISQPNKIHNAQSDAYFWFMNYSFHNSTPLHTLLSGRANFIVQQISDQFCLPMTSLILTWHRKPHTHHQQSIGSLYQVGMSPINQLCARSWEPGLTYLPF